MWTELFVWLLLMENIIRVYIYIISLSDGNCKRLKEILHNGRIF